MDYRDKNWNKIPYEILLLSHKRRQAKLAKDRSKADALRDELRSLGYEMKDGKEGYEVVKIS
jgi:cysteinyl-tRNA synthetase